ncbi:unnamed protein product [Ectocarpus fasciculatus]
MTRRTPGLPHQSSRPRCRSQATGKWWEGQMWLMWQAWSRKRSMRRTKQRRHLQRSLLLLRPAATEDASGRACTWESGWLSVPALLSGPLYGRDAVEATT